MRVVADIGKCDGYASCVVAAPTIFDINDEGLVELLVEHPAQSDRTAVEEAVRVCPARALSIVEG
jgi:ferredoxin